MQKGCPDSLTPVEPVEIPWDGNGVLFGPVVSLQDIDSYTLAQRTLRIAPEIIRLDNKLYDYVYPKWHQERYIGLTVKTGDLLMMFHKYRLAHKSHRRSIKRAIALAMLVCLSTRVASRSGIAPVPADSLPPDDCRVYHIDPNSKQRIIVLFWTGSTAEM